MAKEKVKASQTPHMGYRFQTLFGVALLTDWLENPAKFTGMRFDADDKKVAPTGLDDIVVQRADGLIDYWQVKYTPPEAKAEFRYERARLAPGAHSAQRRAGTNCRFPAVRSGALRGSGRS